MQIIAIANQKGGVAKTTTTQATAHILTDKGYKVLVIDLDGQRDLSVSMAADLSKGSVYNMLIGESYTIQHTQYADIIAGSSLMADIDADIERKASLKMTKYKRLGIELDKIKNNYDVVLLDCPPALSTPTLNALCCANGVVIPAQADAYNLLAIKDITETIEAVREGYNKDLKIYGILLTRHNPAYLLNKQIIEDFNSLAAENNTKVYQAYTNETITVKEAQVQQLSIKAYAPKSKIEQNYELFTEELLKQLDL